MNKLDSQKLAKQCGPVADLLKAIAHPQRLMILCHLAEGEKTVSQLEQYSGSSQSSVSQYLSKMKAEGLVSAQREGQQMLYRIESHELNQLLRAMQKIFCG